MQTNTIVPCTKDCLDCNEDIDKYNKLINELSTMHYKNSLDPVVLCSASFKDFGRENWSKIPEMQSALFTIAHRHHLLWTQTK